MKFKDFLVKAKKETYASGNSPKKLADGFEEFSFEEGKYKYQDRYYARDPNPFGGEEVVFKDEKPVWMMNYYGFILGKVSHSDLYAFLRKAMSALSANKPFRGPSKLKEGSFEYTNIVKGNIDNFIGTEIIYFKGKEVYKLEYHGGKL